MKELTIEEKAKRYDRTIERAKIALDCCGSTSITTKNTIYGILPELRESEDEKIRKDIVAAVETYGDFTQGRKEEIYTWLEKQGEQKHANKIEPKFHEGDWITNGIDCTFQIASIENGIYYDTNNCGSDIESTDKSYHLWTVKDAKDGDVLATPNYLYIFNSIDKETETVSFYCLMKKSDEHFSFGDYKIHDEILNSTPATKEQCDLLFKKMKEEGYIWDADKKLVDKIEPKLKVESKFHIDDWIVFNGLILYIEEVVNGFYKTVSIDGIHRSYDWNIDNAARLWTIQEAKCGDVLTDGKFIGIFKDNNYNPTDKYGCMCFYCSFDIYNDEFYTESGGYNPTYFYPTTKEQYNVLMKAITDAGYTFDFENKKLNKIDTYCQENCKGFQETGKCFCDGECKAKKEYMEQKHTELNEDDENMIRYIGNAITCKESAKYLEEKGVDMIKAHRWLESFKDKVLQKQEWSKEDDGFVDLLLAIFNNSHPNGIFTTGDIAVFNGNCVRSDKIINWIKSLKYKVQPKQEWSEEDEIKRNALIGLVEEIKNQPLKRLEDWDGYISWLKSLRHQPKQELSEDDKDYYDAIIAKLEVTKDDSLLTDNQMEFLKSLKNKI